MTERLSEVDTFAIARSIANGEADVRSTLQALPTEQAKWVWLVVTGWYHEAKAARGEAEKREIDLLFTLSKVQRELSDRIADERA